MKSIGFLFIDDFLKNSKYFENIGSDKNKDWRNNIIDNVNFKYSLLFHFHRAEVYL